MLDDVAAAEITTIRQVNTLAPAPPQVAGNEPSIHHLFANVLNSLSVELQSVRIERAAAGAALVLVAGEDTLLVAARAADAVALAIRVDCAIYVSAD